MRLPTRRWFDASSFLIRVAGFVALLSLLFKHPPHRLAEAEHIVPVHLTATSHLISFGLGLGLLYMASQITLRKRTAWYMASYLLAGLIAAELVHFRNPLQISLYAATLASLYASRRQFVVRSDPDSLRRGLIIAAGLLLVVGIFVTVALRSIHNETIGSMAALEYANRHDRLLLMMVRVSGAASLVIVGWSLFRPLRLRSRATHGQRKQARRLLKLHSGTSEDYFKLWPADKHYYFYGEAFLAYGVVGNTALVLDGAAGNPAEFDDLRQQFLEYSRLNGWSVAVLRADSAEAQAWQNAGLHRLFIGSEAVVDCQEFAVSTVRNKHFRYVTNKAAKEGLAVEFWQPPLTNGQLDQLRTVSDAWLAHGGRREYSFVMGYFDPSYIRNCQVAVLVRRDQTAKIIDGDDNLESCHSQPPSTVIAYANIIETFSPKRASIDHMRSVSGLSTVAMHFLLRSLAMHFESNGVKTFNLGLALLSKLDEQLEKSISERLLPIIKRLGSRYYSFEGLEQFKGKFAPDWEPRYVLYQGPPTRLLAVAAALNKLTAYQSGQARERNRRRASLLVVAALAGLTYSSFPLAYWLNRPLLWHGLASDLGQSNQPYAGLFNSLDVVSSLLAIVLSVMLLRFYLPILKVQRYIRWAVLGLLISNCGALVAALVTLPAGFSADMATLSSVLQPGVIIHGLSSFVNSAAFVLAALLWGAGHSSSFRKTGGRLLADWRLLTAIGILAISTVGAAVGYVLPASSPYIQRLFIISYTLWLVLFTNDITKPTGQSG